MRDKERNPRFITSRAYKRRVSERDQARAQLAEYTGVSAFLGLAQEIKRTTQTNIAEGHGEEEAVKLALSWAQDKEMRRLIEEHARTKRVELTEAQQEDLRARFVAEEQARIDDEVAAEVAAQEEGVRRRVAAETERTLKQLGRDELLSRIGTDEAEATKRRFGDLAIAKAQQEALVAELQQKAKDTRMVELADLPRDAVITLGLGVPEEDDKASTAKQTLRKCDRILELRIADPELGVLEVLDDSWATHKDTVRRAHAFEDQTLLTIPADPEGYIRSQISRNTEPGFHAFAGSPINMFDLEAQVLVFGEKNIFE